MIFSFLSRPYGSTGSRDQISIKAPVKYIFYFRKYIHANLENTTKDNKKRLVTSVE